MWDWLQRLLGSEKSSESAAPRTEAFARPTSVPSFVAARLVEQFALGGYRCEIQTAIRNHIDRLIRIEYVHLLTVFVGEDPCLFVASEVNAMNPAFGGGTHLLMVYLGDSVLRVGSGDVYGDGASFRSAALDVAKRCLLLPSDAPITLAVS